MPKPSLQERIEDELAKLLKERREKLGLSKAAVAERSGHSQMEIYYVEEGKRTPGIDTLLHITKALEVELWKVLKTATEAAKRGAAE